MKAFFLLLYRSIQQLPNQRGKGERGEKGEREERLARSGSCRGHHFEPLVLIPSHRLGILEAESYI